MVLGVKHTVDNGSWKTDFTLVRSGLGFNEKAEKLMAKPVTAQAQPGAGTQVVPNTAAGTTKTSQKVAVPVRVPAGPSYVPIRP